MQMQYTSSLPQSIFCLFVCGCCKLSDGVFLSTSCWNYFLTFLLLLWSSSSNTQCTTRSCMRDISTLPIRPSETPSLRDICRRLLKNASCTESWPYSLKGKATQREVWKSSLGSGLCPKHGRYNKNRIACSQINLINNNINK